MGLIAPTLPTIGQQRGDGEVSVRSTLVALLNEFNGNIESANIKDGSITAADLASGVVKVKPYPANVVVTQETRTNTAYGLMTTPDRVQNVVLPTNGLIAIAYQARWQESVLGAARAAIFIGANQLKTVVGGTTAPVVQEADIGYTAGANFSLSTHLSGLVGINTSGYTGDVTTGQIVGMKIDTTDSTGSWGGFCLVFAAAGTYDISVQYKASSGNVLADNRKLWVATLDFS